MCTRELLSKLFNERGNQYDYLEGLHVLHHGFRLSRLIISKLLIEEYLTNDDVKHLLEASADKVPGMQVKTGMNTMVTVVLTLVEHLKD
jgi:hypothetical protein